MSLSRKSLSIGLIVLGLLFIGGGLYTTSPSSAVATVDCGCGGQTQCVTKQSVLHLGGVLTVAGVIFVAGGSLTAVRYRKSQTARG